MPPDQVRRIVLEETHFRLVLEILAAHAPRCTAWVFGSRAKGTAKRHSDLDLALEQSGAVLDAQQMGQILDAFEESDLPFKVDVIDWRNTSETFKRCVDADRVLLRAPDI